MSSDRPSEQQIIEAIHVALKAINDPSRTYDVKVDAINGRALIDVTLHNGGPSFTYVIHVFAR